MEEHGGQEVDAAGGGSRERSNCNEGSVRSRWTPKPEQILILESIFNSGMVNPPKDETVRIRKVLEKFGSVGDANVFYWFQNRRSRSRRRQRQQIHEEAAATTTNQQHGHYQNTDETAGAGGCGGSGGGAILHHGYHEMSGSSSSSSLGGGGGTGDFVNEQLCSFSGQVAGFPGYFSHDQISSSPSVSAPLDTTSSPSLHYQSPGKNYTTLSRK